MNTIEISINSQKYVLKGDESEDHLKEIAELVLKKVDSLRKTRPDLSLQKASILAALDFASIAVKGNRKAADYQQAVIQQATGLMDHVQEQLS